MAGTRVGGQKAASKNESREPGFYARIGRKGGSATYKGLKGFAADPELASRAGKLGGRKSRRRSVVAA